MGKKKQSSNQKNKTKDEDSSWDEVAQMAARNEVVEQQGKKKQKSSSEQSNNTTATNSSSNNTTGIPFTDQQIRHLVETLSARLKNEEKAELETIEQETVKTISDLKLEVLQKLGMDSSQSDKLKTVTQVLDKHFDGVAKQNSELKRENAILTLRLQTSEIRGVEGM